jgi:DNA-binding CsgD family transcriptional regulator
VAPALAGRRAELTVLEGGLEAVEGGTARTLCLRGEAGIGKSRLLAELVTRARARGFEVLTARASELERDLPYALLGDAFAAETRPTVLAGERHLVARGVRAALERAASAHPVLLALDDVHWADPASADAIALLAHRPPQARVLLALALRPVRTPVVEAALEAGARAGEATVLDLEPLDREAVDALLADLRPAARERLYRDGGGNPFYLQELARMPEARTGAGHQAELPGVPRAVRAALGAEVDALADPVRRVLEGAAVAGDPFEPELAAVAAGVDEAAALEALDVLSQADLVRPVAARRRFRFRHPLVRRAVYEGAGAGWRLGAHARAAAALEARGATPAQRAVHVQRAARPGDAAAIDLLATAAAGATAAAPETAAGWLDAALHLLPEDPEHDDRRLALMQERAEALLGAGRAAEAREVVRGLLARLPAGAVEARAQAAEALADLDVWLCDPEAARIVLVGALAALRPDAHGPAAALTLALARERATVGAHDEALALADEATARARAAGDRLLEADGLAMAADAAHCALRRDDPAALADVDRRVAAARATVDGLGDEELAGRLPALMSLTIAELFTDGHVAAAAGAERGLAIARRTGQGFHVAPFLILRGYAAEELGRLDVAADVAEEALDSALVSGHRHVAFWGCALAAWTELARGQVEAALAHAQRSLAIMEDDPNTSGAWTCAAAHLAAGDPEAAARVLAAYEWVHPGLWSRDRLRALDVTVRVLLALRRVEEAAAWAARAPAEGGGRRSGAFGAMIARAQAGVLLAQGRAEPAAELAREGARAAAGARAPLWAGRCRTLAGEALVAAGRVEEGRLELRRAAADLDALGAWGDRDAALRPLRRLGERPRPRPGSRAAAPADARLEALTRRERQVAVLVGEGLTNAQVAARLHLSERTVEKHVSSILAKLGVSSRAGVVRLLAREPAATR